MIERIREAAALISIYDLLDTYGQTVDRSRSRKIFCPVHEDENKSAVVYPETNEIWCFTCHQTYDAVSLLVELEGMKYPEACTYLEERAGVVYERRERPEDGFWATLRRHEDRLAGEPLSRQEAYRLRWAIHRTVLEVADREAVDWAPFDEAGLDVSKMKRWKQEVLDGDSPASGRLDIGPGGGGSPEGDPAARLADDQVGGDPRRSGANRG